MIDREKVARAICDRTGGNWHEADALAYLAAADAAIASVLEQLREPSEAMLDAFVARALQVSVHGDGGWSAYGKAQWQTMLNAAFLQAESSSNPAE